MKNFQAVIENKTTKETYTIFIKAVNAVKADTALEEAFEDLFVNTETKEQDDYTHDVEELTDFPKLPENTSWTETLNGSAYAIFKKIN